MYYLEVLVAGAAFHGSSALTYAYNRLLPVGTVVTVPLRKAQALGIVSKEVTRPQFTTKSILEVPELPPLPLQLIKLLEWMQAYYPSTLGIITQQFLPKKLPKKLAPEALVATTKVVLPPLTPDQERALSTIQETGTYLVHGDTGTGKTRLYIELAKRALEKGESVIVLTPEIGLTSQLAAVFRSVFGNCVVVIHSQLSDVVRQRLWVNLLRSTTPVIVVGARSALFSPLHKLGLIVLDESHETAYKQDQAPYYHASRVAATLGTLHGAPVILGSATPLIGDYFLAKAKNRPIIRLTQTATTADQTQRQVTLVDLRDKTKFSKKSHLSDQLIDAMARNLAKGEQTLLFLNRRGTARIVFCESCGWQALCPNCDIPLVYHGDTHTMRCHSCDHTSNCPVSCPNCHNSAIIFKSIGTKAIVDEAAKLFPDARLMRFDNDNKKHERIEQHYEAVKRGEVDILIGTQTLAKGLDLPKLSLVGIVLADASLSFPDFSATERTYQLLSQVIGRVGRGHRSGEIILQTYNPESALIKSILKNDWADFYDREIQERKAFQFPPFCHLLKLTCRRATMAAAQEAAETLAKRLYAKKLPVLIEGPSPAFQEKVRNKFQWQLVIKSKSRNELLLILSLLPSGWSYDIDPVNLL